MKKCALLLGVVTAISCGILKAQDAVSAAREVRSLVDPRRDAGPTPLDLFRVESSYVFSSQLENGTGYGKQDALQSSIEYSHRFLLTGRIYLRAGVSYDRFDFGSTGAPVPDHLHSLAGVVALEYVVGKDVGAFLQVRPGYYAEGSFGSSSFDVPITLGRIFVLQQDQLFLFVGATAAFLRADYPVLPLAGLVWRPNEQWSVFAVVPEPRITYSPSRNLDLWVGGQLVGGSFRTDHDPNIQPRSLSGAVVTYSEYRAGLGVEFRWTDTVGLNIGGGYALQRRFNFARADESYETKPAPYLRAAFKAEF
ncbi:MAG: hypothetical protein H0V56_07855 [Chthoniobacterales bacterium]|nr:hypothetical protein [Chthoniobacterales bacterium]